MKIKIFHPLWTHIPAFAVLVYFIIRLLGAGSLPVQAPTHFGFNGIPNDSGSPWMVFGLIIGLSVFFIILSSALDEVWAKNETGKTFNWFAIFDEITVGSMVAISLQYLDYLQSGEVDRASNSGYCSGNTAALQGKSGQNPTRGCADSGYLIPEKYPGE
jgi:hypothetical protein